MTRQLLDAVRGPHGAADVVLWVVAGTALVVAAVELVRPVPRHTSWSRLRAAALPLAAAVTVGVTPLGTQLRGDAFTGVMLLRTVGFWSMVIAAPITVGQALRLRPPLWLHRAHLAIAGTHLLLFGATDLVYGHPPAHSPADHVGALTTPLLLPVAALAGWWLLLALTRVGTGLGSATFALGGSATALALVVAALVIDPVLADHFLVVAFLPVLLATIVVQLDDARRDWWASRRAAA